jgi:hypothetical protein
MVFQGRCSGSEEFGVERLAVQVSKASFWIPNKFVHYKEKTPERVRSFF